MATVGPTFSSQHWGMVFFATSTTVRAGTVTMGAAADSELSGPEGSVPGESAALAVPETTADDGADAAPASSAKVPAGASAPLASAMPAAAVPSAMTVHSRTASGVDRRMPHGTTGRPAVC